MKISYLPVLILLTACQSSQLGALAAKKLEITENCDRAEGALREAQANKTAICAALDLVPEGSPAEVAQAKELCAKDPLDKVLSYSGSVCDIVKSLQVP